MSSNSYASLKNYNEDYGYCPGKMVLTTTVENETENFVQEEDGPVLIDCIMEGRFFEPSILTPMSGNLTIVSTEDGVMFLLKSRKAKGIISAVIQKINEDDEPGPQIVELYRPTKVDFSQMKSGVLSKGFLLFGSEELPMTRDEFLHLIENKQLMASISTLDYDDGEIAGLLVRHL
jgi:hypothetical protein